MINQVIMVGRLSKDPEFKHLSIGGANVAVCKFSIATNHETRNKQTGEIKKEVCFIECNVWRQEAEKMKDLKKGNEVFVQGRLKLEKWKDKQDQDRFKHSIVVEQVMYNYKLSDEAVYQDMESTKPVVKQQVIKPVQQSDFEDELPF